MLKQLPHHDLEIRWVHCKFYISFRSRLPPFHNTTCSTKTLQWVSSPEPKNSQGFQQVEDQMPRLWPQKSIGGSWYSVSMSKRKGHLSWTMPCLANGRLLKENLAMVQNKWRWDSFWISGIILIKTCVYCEWLYLLIDKSNRQIHHIPCIYIEYRPNIHGQHLIIHILSVSYRRLCSLAWKLLPLMLTDHVLPIDGRASPLNDSPFHPTKAEQWCSLPNCLNPMTPRNRVCQSRLPKGILWLKQPSW